MKYNIFKNGFNKVLELVEFADLNVINKYKEIINQIPEESLEMISELEDFNIESNGYIVDMVVSENKIDLEVIRNKNYAQYQMQICRYYPFQLFPSLSKSLKFIPIEPIRLIKIAERNTKNKNEDLNFYFEQKDGEITYFGNNDTSNGKIVDFEFEVFIEMIGTKYCLTSVLTFRGVEVYAKRKYIHSEQLFACAEKEDPYKEDIEIDFDADFDL